jgi:hypothetical protein
MRFIVQGSVIPEIAINKNDDSVNCVDRHDAYVNQI